MAAQIFDGTGGKRVLQVMVAGTVGMLICFNAHEYLIIIGSFIKAVDKVKAFSTDDSVCRPTDIKIRIADGSERSMLSVADPERATAVRVAGSEAQAGELCLGVQLGSDGVAFGNRQLIGADRGEGVLGVNIKGGNVFFFRQLHSEPCFLF